MFKKKTVAAILAIMFILINTGFGQTLKSNWSDFLHYTKIGRLDLAKGFAQAVIESNPAPEELLVLSLENPQGYRLLLKVNESAVDAELVELSGKVLDIIERGRFAKRASPRIIAEEIRRLSSTARGRLAAIKRLANAGEYAIPFMLDVLSDESRREEFSNIVGAISQMGRDSIRPLVAALQTEDIALKAEVIKGLGKISYPQSLAYLKYAVEKDKSSQVRSLAGLAIAQIDPAASSLAAAQLFYLLAENYYYHADSLTPAEDAAFGNIWFWDAGESRLVSQKVDRNYFNELMAMRCCEWALKADAGFGQAIGLWLAAYSRAEAVGINMPEYFGLGHADVMTYATTAGAEYLHQALERAIKDKDAEVGLCMVEALAGTAGEKTLFYRVGLSQPLIEALSFNDKAVRYSAAIAIAAAGPKEGFAEKGLVVENLAQALGETDLTNKWSSESYAFRTAKVMLRSAERRNRVIDLSAAQTAIVAATKDSREEIQILAGRILARLAGAAAQRAITAMALVETNSMDVRILAFDSLAVSAKLNGSLLGGVTIDAVYLLVSSQEIDPELRSAAAAAYGALNLPSQKVKDLILDQSRS